MKKKPLLTIGIPAYNVELFIEETTTSVATSKHSDIIEILIINDGSTDQTLQVAKTLEKKYPCVKVIDKPNGGHGSAINSALKNATGKYFRLLDGDDWFDTEEFDGYIEKLQSETADIVFTDLVEHFIKTGLNRPITYYPNLPEYKTLPLDTVHFLEWGPMLPTTTIKTDILKKFNLKIDENCYYVDQEYNLACYLASKTASYYPFMIYQYRLEREGQSMQKTSLIKNVKSHEIVCKRLLDIFHKHLKTMTNTRRKHLSKKIIIPMCYMQYVIAIEYCKSKERFLSFDKIIKLYPNFYNDPGIAGTLTRLHRKTKGHLVKIDPIIRKIADKKNKIFISNNVKTKFFLLIGAIFMITAINALIINCIDLDQTFSQNNAAIYYEESSNLVKLFNQSPFDGLKAISESMNTERNLLPILPMIPFLKIFDISKLSYILIIFNLYILPFAILMTQTFKYTFHRKKRPIKWWLIPIVFAIFLLVPLIIPSIAINPNAIDLTIIGLILYLIAKTKLRSTHSYLILGFLASMLILFQKQSILYILGLYFLIFTIKTAINYIKCSDKKHFFSMTIKTSIKLVISAAITTILVLIF